MKKLKDIEFINNKDYRYYLYAIACVLVLWIFEPKITEFCLILSRFIIGCNEIPFAIGVVLLALHLCIKVGRPIFTKHKTYVAHKHIAVLIPLISVYVFYRFIDNCFYFWGFDIGYHHFAWLDFLVIPLVFRIIQKCSYKKPNSANEATTYILSDNPIKKKEDDVFGYYNLTSELLSDLKTIDTSKRAFSVGIVGSWGYGKSSFLNLFCEHVKSFGDICFTFNPRSSKDVKYIQEDFLKSLCNILTPFHSDVDHKLLKYAQALDLVDEKWIAKTIKLFEKLDPIDEKKSINRAIQNIGKRIFVIIDDFDRLNAEEIIEILKLIERNADFSHIIYLTAYDKNYVNAILAKHLPGEATQNFTDKYFNLEYTLPHQDKKILINSMFQYLNNNLISEDNQEALQPIREVLQKNYNIISKHLTSLRHIKRFVNIFLSRYPKVKDDVFLHDFLILTLIRYIDIKTYHAIANRLMIINPSLFNESNVYVLAEDYQKVLERINAKDGVKDLLECLFPQKNNSSEHAEYYYGKIRSIKSFDLYFYDYQIGRLYYKDLIQLFNSTSVEDSFNLIDQYANNNILDDVAEFLRSRSASWIGNCDKLSRLFNLIAYTNEKDRNYRLEIELRHCFSSYMAKEYEDLGVTKDDYRKTICDSISFMTQYAPIGLGFVCQQQIESICSESPSKSIKNELFTLQELEGFAIEAQKQYLNTFDTPYFNFGTALYLSKIIKKNVINIMIHPAKEILIAFMREHAELVANKLVVFEHNNNENYLEIGLHPSFYPHLIFPLDDYDFNSWIKELPDANMRFVISKLYDNLLGSKRFVRIKPLQTTYKEIDFNAFEEAIKQHEKDSLDESIFQIINEGNVFDINYLVERTKSNKQSIVDSIRRLVNKEAIDSFYLNLNDMMEPFEEGDIVHIKNASLMKYSIDYPNIKNLLTISSIKGNIIDIKEIPELSIPKNEIIPVRINGIDDKSVYFNPIIAATTVFKGGIIPSYKEDKTYFMNRFENCFDEKNVSYKELIKKYNFLYVHEVQHWLRKENGNDDLEIEYQQFT